MEGERSRLSRASSAGVRSAPAAILAASLPPPRTPRPADSLAMRTQGPAAGARPRSHTPKRQASKSKGARTGAKKRGIENVSARARGAWLEAMAARLLG